MACIFGTDEMQHLGMPYCLCTEMSMCVVVYALFNAGGVHFSDNIRFGFKKSALSLQLLCERYVKRILN